MKVNAQVFIHRQSLIYTICMLEIPVVIIPSKLTSMHIIVMLSPTEPLSNHAKADLTVPTNSMNLGLKLLLNFD